MEVLNRSYTWKVTDPDLIKRIKTAKQDTIFKSPIFSLFDFRWYLELRPNGTGVYEGAVSVALYLTTFSPKLKSIRFKRTYNLLETGSISDYVETITHDEMCTFAWPASTLKTKDIQKYNQFTFKVNMTLIAVYDKDDNDVTNQFLTCEEIKTDSNASFVDYPLNSAKLDSLFTQFTALSLTVQKISQKVNNIELRMNEEEKDNTNNIETKLHKLEQNMNKLMLNINIDPEQQKLKQWLEKQVKLPQYYQVFIDRGIDDLETAALITKDVLKEMNIDKIGHQMKLLNHAKKLNVNEGAATSYI